MYSSENSRFLTCKLSIQPMYELPIYACGQAEHQPICFFVAHNVVDADGTRVSEVRVREDMGWRACYHCRFETGLMAVFHDVEGSVGGADNNYGL